MIYSLIHKYLYRLLCVEKFKIEKLPKPTCRFTFIPEGIVKTLFYLLNHINLQIPLVNTKTIIFWLFCIWLLASICMRVLNKNQSWFGWDRFLALWKDVSYSPAPGNLRVPRPRDRPFILIFLRSEASWVTLFRNLSPGKVRLS